MNVSPAFLPAHTLQLTKFRRKTCGPYRTHPAAPRKRHAAASPSSMKFNWTDQWYPVALVKDLHPTKPNPLTLLSTPLVAFKTHQTWVVLHDRCPHRFAALSQGRITQNRIECSYHGWQFDHTGTVHHIPQSPGCTALSATLIRTAICDGILFATLGNPSSPPPLVRWGSRRFVVSEFSRIVPLCFTTVIQNLLDPAHIHFAHHGRIGRRELAAPIPIRILSPASEQGFLGDYYSGNVRLRFRPPCLVEIVTTSGRSFAYYTTPVSSSTSKAFAIRGTSYRQLLLPPRWMDHLRRHRLLEDDLGLMQRQQGFMQRVGGYHEGWKEFCMPASADRLIIEMRRWLDQHAPDEEWYGCGSSEDAGRWGHTKQCCNCWRMWCWLGIIRNIIIVTGIICLLAAAGLGSVTLATAAGLLAGVVRSLQFARSKFE